MAVIRLKEIFYDNKPVLTQATRKAVQAKADAEGNIFSETYLKSGDVVELELSSETTSGTLSVEQYTLLLKNNLNRLVLNNIIYYLAYKDTDTRKYAADVLDQYGNMQLIELTLYTRQWLYKAIGNQALADHIANTNVHIQSGERDSWNNKITCDKQGENLIFTKD